MRVDLELNRLNRYIIIIIGALTISACGSKEKKEETNSGHHLEMPTISPVSCHFLEPEVEPLEAATSCRKILISVVDTGIDYEHPELKDNICRQAGTNLPYGFNFSNDNADAFDDNYHGTHVAGIIGAKHDSSGNDLGICYEAALVPVKFMDNAGIGTSSDAVEAIIYSIQIGSKIINASWGSDTGSQWLQESVGLAETAGVLIVAASGNSAKNLTLNPTFPASYPNANIITVGATGSGNSIASFSNYDPLQVDIAAPGVSILSTVPTSATSQMTLENISANYANLSGTSMATPQVTAAAAYIWNQKPRLTAAEVKEQIFEATEKKDSLLLWVSGGRKLDITKALEMSL